jgi:tetratricopeptide (TPR) repeat protein
MAKSGKRPHGAHGTSGPPPRQRHDGPRPTGDREQAPALSPDQEAAVAALLADMPRLAEALVAAGLQGRDAVGAALAPVEAAAEPVQRAFAARLGDIRGPLAHAAAEVAHALGELHPHRDIAREARRARIRLRSVGALPTLELVAPSAPAATAVAPIPAAPTAPILVEAHATRTREEGEVSLALAWQEGSDPNIVRGCTITLEFWQHGVSDFWLSEPMTRQRFLRETVNAWRTEEEMESVSISWAQARRLLLAALDVNAWRGTEPDAAYHRHQSLIAARLIDIPDTQEARAAVAAEDERAAREGDRPYLAGDLEPEDTLANWLGAWCFGDYGVAYDLLGDEEPIRREQTRAAYVAERRRWADEAQPVSLRLTLIREQTQRASALWVPGATGTVAPGGRRELEAFWSITLGESPLGGTFPELPLATISSQETGRHWYWTAYTIERDRRDGGWRITRIRDEGANSQALTVEELQKRIQEARVTVDQLAATPPQGEEAAREALRTLTGALTAALHYRDALIARLPLDETLYREGVSEAQTLGSYERAAALLERMRGRFPAQARTTFELGAQYYLMGVSMARAGNVEAERTWLERAASAFRQAAESEPSADYLEMLGEVLARQGHYTQAIARLREAIALEPTRATAHSALADCLMSEASGDNLDELAPGAPLGEAARDQRIAAAARAALAELRETARLDPSVHGLYTRIGAIYDVLHQHEDALVAFQEAVRQEPGDPDAHYALGSVYLQRQEYTLALPELEQAAQLAPFVLSIRINLAACYIALERWRDAERELDFLDEARPGMPQVAELRTIMAKEKRK